MLPAAIITAYGSAVLAAATTTPGTDPAAWFIPAGGGASTILGALFILWLRGYIHSAGEVKRLEEMLAVKDAAIVKKDEQIERLQSGIVNDAMPLIGQSTAALARLTPILERLTVQTDVSYRDPGRPQ